MSDIFEEMFLFFHAPTMKIISLDKKKDSEIIRFLQSFTENGPQITRRIMRGDYDLYYSQICNILESAPYSTTIRSKNNSPILANVVLPIASSCNLCCPYCFAQTNNGFHFKSYTKGDIERTITLLAENYKKHRQKVSIAFFGGEPLIKYDLIKFCLEFTKQNYPNIPISYSITTNGTLITSDVIETFKKYNVDVLVSVDGLDNEFNMRKFHDGRKSIELVLKNIKELRDNGINVQLRATMINTNPYILQTFRFFEEIEIPFSIVFAYSSENTNHDYSTYNADILAGIRNQLEGVYEYYVEKIYSGAPIYNMKFHAYAKTVKMRIKRDISCASGRTFFTLMSNGDIFTCSHYMNNPKYIVGNIFAPMQFKEDKLSKLSPEKLYRHKSCTKCWARYLCLGGCTSQIIIAGGTNVSSYMGNECELMKIEFILYLKMFFHAFKCKYSGSRNIVVNSSC